MGPETLAQLNGLGPYVLMDEVYRGIQFVGDVHTVLEYEHDRIIVADGFSKRYAMTGWRLGYLVLPEQLRRPFQIIQQNMMISANHFVQIAGVAAVTSKEVEKLLASRVATLAQRRQHVLDRLADSALRVVGQPDGAFYVLLDVGATQSSVQTSLELLEETGVAMTPAADFGKQVEKYLRLTFLHDNATLDEGLDRLEKWAKQKGWTS